MRDEIKHFYIRALGCAWLVFFSFLCLRVLLSATSLPHPCGNSIFGSALHFPARELAWPYPVLLRRASPPEFMCFFVYSPDWTYCLSAVLIDDERMPPPPLLRFPSSLRPLLPGMNRSLLFPVHPGSVTTRRTQRA